MSNILSNGLFKHEVVTTSKVFGRSGNIKVVFSGNDARTNGETIFLPQLNDAATLKDDYRKSIRGYVDHEAAHIRYSNFKTAKRALDKGGVDLLHLVNGLEDPRIEGLTIKEYPGSAKNLRTLGATITQFFWQQLLLHGPACLMPKAIAALACTWVGRRMIGIGSPEIDACIDAVDPRIIQLIEPYVAKAIKAKDTNAVLKLAEQLMPQVQALHDEMKSQQPQQPKQPQTSQPPQGQPPQTQTQTSDSDDDSDDQAKGDGEGEGSPDEDDPHGDDQHTSNRSSDDDEDGEDQEDDGDGSVASGGDEEGDEDEDEASADDADADGEGDADEDDGGEGNASARNRSDGASEVEEPVDEDEDGDGAVASEADDVDGADDEPSSHGGVEGSSDEGGTSGAPVQDLAPLDPSLSKLFDLIKQEQQGETGETFCSYNPEGDLLVKHDTTNIPSTFDSAKTWQRVMEMGLGLRDYNDLQSRFLTGVVGSMTKEFERIFAARLQRDRLRGQLMGRLDSRMLVQAYQGKQEVFWQRGERQELDTAVTILLDCSASMTWDSGQPDGSSRMQMAIVSLIALSEALDRLAIPFGIYGFTGMGYAGGTDAGQVARARAEASAMGVDPSKLWHRTYPMGIVEVKAAHERLATVRHRIGAAMHLPWGGTPLADAIKTVWPFVAKRSETRKVLLVLTDGAPSETEWVRPMILEAERQGVAVVGIGICADVVSKYFDRCAVVHTAPDLVGSMMRELKLAMTQGQRRAA